jgi:uncharacterized membrane protein
MSVSLPVAVRSPRQQRDTSRRGIHRLPRCVPRTGPARIAAALAVVQFVLLSVLTVRQLRGAGSNNWDLGIFNNAVWALAHGESFMNYRGMDVLGHHFNPIFYVFAPFSWLGADALFLCLAQVLFLVLGAVPAYLIGRDRLGTDRRGLAICALYLLHPAVTGLSWWMFHPETLAIPAVLAAWWAATQGRWKLFSALIIWCLLCREDVALATAGLGAVLTIGRWPGDRVFRNPTARRVGAVICIASLTWYLGLTQFVMPSRLPTDEPYYVQDFFGHLGSTMPEVIETSLKHPDRALSQVSGGNGVSFGARLLGPTGGMALAQPILIIPALPQLAAATLSNDPDSRMPWHHHAAIVVPFMIIAGAESLRRWRDRPKRLTPIMAWMLTSASISYLLFSPTPLGPLGDKWSGPTEKGAAVREAARIVPRDASVAATVTPGTEMTTRRDIYTWPAPWARWKRGWEFMEFPDPNSVEYLVLARDEIDPKRAELLKTLTGPGGEFVIEWERAGVFIAKRVRPGTLVGEPVPPSKSLASKAATSKSAAATR